MSERREHWIDHTILASQDSPLQGWTLLALAISIPAISIPEAFVLLTWPYRLILPKEVLQLLITTIFFTTYTPFNLLTQTINLWKTSLLASLRFIPCSCIKKKSNIFRRKKQQNNLRSSHDLFMGRNTTRGHWIFKSANFMPKGAILKIKCKK